MATTGSTRAVPAAARCRGCGYSLLGLGEHRCPECVRAFDPTRRGTMRLPRRSRRLVRWLLRPQSRLGRSFPVIGILAVAFGTYQPGWQNRIFIAGAIIIIGCVLGTLPSWIAWAAVRTRINSPVAEPFREWNRRLARAVVVVVALAVLRPTMYLCFWVSKPWLEPVARNILAQPFTQPAGTENSMRGLYRVTGARRCPHGVKLKVAGDAYTYDDGPGFFYRSEAGHCERFNLRWPMGGGWYACD